MSIWVKQSVAVDVLLGPFIDDTDFKTAKTALTLNQADIRLSKNAGGFAQTNNVTGGTHRENGNYLIPLNATDTDTLGRLRVVVNKSSALQVWQDFMVVPANVWDAYFSSGTGHVGLALQIIRTGTAQAGAAASITLDSGASASDTFYNNTLIHITSGTGTGQARAISGYVGSTKVATITPNWVTNPDATSVFVILPAGTLSVPTKDEIAAATWDKARSSHTTAGSFGEGVASVNDTVIRRGTAQASTVDYIRLDAGASAVDNYYRDLVVTIISGTGAGQSRLVSSYVGATKDAYVWYVWNTAPDTTSIFRLTIGGPVDVAFWGSGAVNALIGGRVDANAGVVGDKTGYALTSAERDSIADASLDRAGAIEVGLTPRQALRLIAAALAGKLSGAATTTITIRNAVQDSKARITATVDVDGNRSAITYDVT